MGGTGGLLGLTHRPQMQAEPGHALLLRHRHRAEQRRHQPPAAHLGGEGLFWGPPGPAPTGPGAAIALRSRRFATGRCGAAVLYGYAVFYGSVARGAAVPRAAALYGGAALSATLLDGRRCRATVAMVMGRGRETMRPIESFVRAE